MQDFLYSLQNSRKVLVVMMKNIAIGAWVEKKGSEMINNQLYMWLMWLIHARKSVLCSERNTFCGAKEFC